MADTKNITAVQAEALQFVPEWIYDPVPPFIVQQLGREQLIQIALIGMEVRNEVLEASLKANAKAMQVIQGKFG